MRNPPPDRQTLVADQSADLARRPIGNWLETVILHTTEPF